MSEGAPNCKPQVLHVIAASVSPHADGRALLVRCSEGGMARLVFSEKLSAQVAAELGWRPPMESSVVVAKPRLPKTPRRTRAESYAARRAATAARFQPVLTALAAPENQGKSASAVCRSLGLEPVSFLNWRNNLARRAKKEAAA